VVFTGNKARNVKDAMPGMVRLTPKKLKEIPTVLGVKDPIKYLKLTPGIQSAEGGNRGIFVRGWGADQNLIMLDQTSLYNPSHLGGMFSIFIPETIKNLEVHKGNIPAYYGGRLSSVISLNTNKGDTEKMNYKGNLGMLSSSFYIDLNTSMK
jgi:outer membrane receptor for ferrienterochelin and colicin